jgi:ABC-type bacteriocin/lantibiotic exporter with double-glycine peptidase domain
MQAIAADHLIEDRPTAVGVEPPRMIARGPIRLDDVSFTYPGNDRPVLHGIDLRIGEGERVGIVGASGSGKSTLIELLGALYFPTSGEITVGGTSLTMDPKGWQQTIGYVPQVPFIMPGTIRDNVAFETEHDIKDAEVWRVLEQVGLSMFVRSLPAGLATDIGEKGQGLSGGQQQLICLARALYRKPAVLLLDEPTAALDGENEQIVLRAIASLPRGTTIVMVSHRPDAFREFDNVYECANTILRSLPAASVLKPR